MDREQAVGLLNKKVTNENLVRHMVATEACMKSLARYFDEDEETWGMAGLLHDVDYEETKEDFVNHGEVSAQILKENNISDDIVNAVKAHASKKKIQNKLEIALYSADPLTGLIVASALMHPKKRLKDVSVKFVLNRFKEKRFACGSSREQIKTCTKLGVSLEDFIGICLKAMKEIDYKLKL